MICDGLVFPNSHRNIDVQRLAVANWHSRYEQFKIKYFNLKKLWCLNTLC